MKPFISLCMIVKNEEKVLERCLSSVSHLVDEIIIIDTGSIDKTKEIALNFTSNIFDFEWINDFSAARNFAASKASGEWILVLDADEYVDEENFNNFIRELKDDQDQFDAYNAKILNFTGNFGESLVQNFHDRIYKNNSEIVYYRKIHEQFKHLKGKVLNIKQSSLLIFHSGYLNQVVIEKDKHSRNNNLLDDEMNEVSNNAFDYFNFGNEYASKGNYTKALDCYLKAYKEKKDYRLNWVSTTLVQIVVCLIQLKRYNDALVVIKDAENIYTNSAEFLFLKGEVFLAKGQLEDAKRTFHQIVDNQQKYNHVILRPDLKDQKPHTRLGEIYLYQEAYNEAIYHFTSVLNINKYNDNCVKKVIFILNKYHSDEEITSFLHKRELLNKKNINNYVKACFEVGNPKLALNLINIFQDDDNKLLSQIALLKMQCIEDEWHVHEFRDILDAKVLTRLFETNWIHIVDLVLLTQQLDQDNILNIALEPLKQIREYTIIGQFINEKTSINDLDGDLIVSSLQTLLNYKKFTLCSLFLKNIETVDEKIKCRVAGLLFSNGFKVEALQLYNQCDWNYFGVQDFINIINSLLETNNKDGAMQVAKYAISSFKEDFRFYLYILENTNDKELLQLILTEVREIFDECLYIEKYGQ